VFALTRILVPTNLGEPSRAAVQYGVEFSRQFGAKLFLVHVLDAKDLDAALETERVLEVLAPDEAERPSGEPSVHDVARKAARHDLSRLLALKDEQDTHAEYLLRPSGSGGAADAIVACARELDVELIVMGKHHLSFVEHMLAGSVTEKVLRHAPCPVLIVQTPEHDFVVADPQHAAAADSLPE
jgi:nucleotide-binding universal stress UspA family protein